MTTTEAPAALLDVNVLLALVDPRHVHHAAAHRWFVDVPRFATTPPTEAGFVRLMMNPHVGGETGATARAALQAVREVPGHTFVVDDVSPAEPGIDTTALVGYRQVTDFHLVDLAAAHGLRLATFDAKVPRSLAERDRVHVVVVPV